jgi:hypothetical protein
MMGLPTISNQPTIGVRACTIYQKAYKEISTTYEGNVYEFRIFSCLQSLALAVSASAGCSAFHPTLTLNALEFSFTQVGINLE